MYYFDEEEDKPEIDWAKYVLEEDDNSVMKPVDIRVFSLDLSSYGNGDFNIQEQLILQKQGEDCDLNEDSGGSCCEENDSNEEIMFQTEEWAAKFIEEVMDNDGDIGVCDKEDNAKTEGVLQIDEWTVKFIDEIQGSNQCIFSMFDVIVFLADYFKGKKKIMDYEMVIAILNYCDNTVLYSNLYECLAKIYKVEWMDGHCLVDTFQLREIDLDIVRKVSALLSFVDLLFADSILSQLGRCLDESWEISGLEDRQILVQIIECISVENITAIARVNDMGCDIVTLKLFRQLYVEYVLEDVHLSGLNTSFEWVRDSINMTHSNRVTYKQYCQYVMLQYLLDGGNNSFFYFSVINYFFKGKKVDDNSVMIQYNALMYEYLYNTRTLDKFVLYQEIVMKIPDGIKYDKKLDRRLNNISEDDTEIISFCEDMSQCNLGGYLEVLPVRWISAFNHKLTTPCSRKYVVLGKWCLRHMRCGVFTSIIRMFGILPVNDNLIYDSCSNSGIEIISDGTVNKLEVLVGYILFVRWHQFVLALRRFVYVSFLDKRDNLFKLCVLSLVKNCSTEVIDVGRLCDLTQRCDGATNNFIEFGGVN